MTHIKSTVMIKGQFNDHQSTMTFFQECKVILFHFERTLDGWVGMEMTMRWFAKNFVYITGYNYCDFPSLTRSTIMKVVRILRMWAFCNSITRHSSWDTHYGPHYIVALLNSCHATVIHNEHATKYNFLLYYIQISLYIA